MRFEQGVQLLSGVGAPGDGPQQWADLGCGSGFFTNILAHLLPRESTITAVDKEHQELPVVMGNNVIINFEQADFTKTNFQFKHADGMLMANALHYVKDKTLFLRNVKQYLKKGAMMVLIEYNTEQENPWVPHPINFTNLQQLLQATGFTAITKIAETASKYNRGNLYSVSALHN